MLDGLMEDSWIMWAKQGGVKLTGTQVGGLLKDIFLTNKHIWNNLASWGLGLGGFCIPFPIFDIFIYEWSLIVH